VIVACVCARARRRTFAQSYEAQDWPHPGQASGSVPVCSRLLGAARGLPGRPRWFSAASSASDGPAGRTISVQQPVQAAQRSVANFLVVERPRGGQEHFLGPPPGSTSSATDQPWPSRIRKTVPDTMSGDRAGSSCAIPFPLTGTWLAAERKSSRLTGAGWPKTKPPRPRERVSAEEPSAGPEAPPADGLPRAVVVGGATGPVRHRHRRGRRRESRAHSQRGAADAHPPRPDSGKQD
jgi:hypothetical protein